MACTMLRGVTKGACAFNLPLPSRPDRVKYLLFSFYICLAHYAPTFALRLNKDIPQYTSLLVAVNTISYEPFQKKKKKYKFVFKKIIGKVYV